MELLAMVLFKAGFVIALLGMVYVELHHFCHGVAPFQLKYAKCKCNVH